MYYPVNNSLTYKLDNEPLSPSISFKNERILNIATLSFDHLAHLTLDSWPKEDRRKFIKLVVHYEANWKQIANELADLWTPSICHAVWSNSLLLQLFNSEDTLENQPLTNETLRVVVEQINTSSNLSKKEWVIVAKKMNQLIENPVLLLDLMKNSVALFEKEGTWVHELKKVCRRLTISY